MNFLGLIYLKYKFVSNFVYFWIILKFRIPALWGSIGQPMKIFEYFRLYFWIPLRQLTLNTILRVILFILNIFSNFRKPRTAYDHFWKFSTRFLKSLGLINPRRKILMLSAHAKLGRNSTLGTLGNRLNFNMGWA